MTLHPAGMVQGMMVDLTGYDPLALVSICAVISLFDDMDAGFEAPSREKAICR